MFRRLLLLASLCVTSSAFAVWSPSFSDNYVEVRATETQTVTLRAFWTRFNPNPDFYPWVCASDSEKVAHVEGVLASPGQIAEVKITGITPGTAWVRILTPKGDFHDALFVKIRVTEAPVTVSIAPSAPTTTVGKPIRLTAISEASRVTFSWYNGARGDRSRPLIGTGNELIVTPTVPGRYSFWVSAVAPHGMSSDEVVIDVNPLPRRRGARH